MANERMELIDRQEVLKIVNVLGCFANPNCPDERIKRIKELPIVDAVTVVHGYNPGDVCIYGFAKKNKSLAIVEIMKILNDERGVAEVKFLKVFVDDTGNGLFNYLLRSGNTMNASFKYLKNITPNCGAKMDGGTEGGK